MNKQVQKAKETIANIKAKGSEATAYDLQRLANAQLKVEQKSINFVYSQLKRAYNAEKPSDFEATIQSIAGSKFPTLSAFKKGYKAKYVSMWGGMGGFATSTQGSNALTKSSAKTRPKPRLWAM